MSTLIIKIDLSRISCPSRAELDNLGYDSPEDFWRDWLPNNAQKVMRTAEIEVED